MRLILLRHAIAEEVHPQGDEFRALTPEGIGKLRRVLRQFRGRFEPPGRIFTSPLVRARQTARLAGRMLELPVTVAPALRPLGSAYAWLCQGQEADLMVVGHEPDLSDLAARFLGSPGPLFSLKKAGLACLEGEPGRGRLVWLVTPRWLV